MFERRALICRRELLEKYRQCKTSAEVIAVQDTWLEVERRAVKSDSIDYPPSCSSSDSDGESMGMRLLSWHNFWNDIMMSLESGIMLK